MSAAARRTGLALAGGLLAGALVLAAPLAASAHVHVDPSTAEPGAAADLTFSVPNESASAATTAVRITLPEGLGAVTAEPVGGWRERVVTSGGRAAAVEFTATGDGVGDGQTQAFVVRVAAVPDTGRVLLPVTQTYSDGTVVDWDEATPASGEEPEHPAPTLYVNDAPPAEHDEAEEESAEGHDAATGSETAAATASDASLPLGLSAAALVVALGALALGIVALLRRR